MRFTIATWNINSVRLRRGLVERLLIDTAPDVLCLQETKTADEHFPGEAFAELGYAHQTIKGDLGRRSGYNGVAILSKHPIVETSSIDFCAMGDARHIAARIAPEGAPEIVAHSLYVPAGGDEPDPESNPKFDHKLRFVDEMAELLRRDPSAPTLVLGDLNIAPLEEDVWSHKQMLKVVSHTPVEVEKFNAAQQAGTWIDIARRFTPENEKLYSWWSYRAKDWAASNRGRRLDHIWASADLTERLVSAVIVKEARGWEKPSDHAPAFATVEL